MNKNIECFSSRCGGQVMWKYHGLEYNAYYCESCGNSQMARLIWPGKWERFIGNVPKIHQPQSSGALKPM